MTALDQNAEDLRAVVEDILYQFRLLDTATANGPHVELSCQELRVVEHLGDRGPRMMKQLAEFLLLAVNSVTSTVEAWWIAICGGPTRTLNVMRAPSSRGCDDDRGPVRSRCRHSAKACPPMRPPACR